MNQSEKPYTVILVLFKAEHLRVYEAYGIDARDALANAMKTDAADYPDQMWQKGWPFEVLRGHNLTELRD